MREQSDSRGSLVADSLEPHDAATRTGLDGADRRTAALESAARVFSDRGYFGASIQDIADQAGLSKQLLIYYCGGKAAIWQGALEQSRRGYERVFVDRLDGLKGEPPTLERVVRAGAEAIVAHPEWWRMVASVGPQGGSILGWIQDNIMAHDTRFFAWAVPAWVARGEIRDVPAHVMQFTVFSSLYVRVGFNRVYPGLVYEGREGVERLVGEAGELLDLLRPVS
jgi:TetR/AcrR family transcriptional regulator